MVLRHRTKRLQVLLESLAPAAARPVKIITGCGVIRETEEESVQLIRSALDEMSSEGTVVVSGCIPRISRKRLEAEFGNRVLIVDDLDSVPEALGLSTTPEQRLATIVVPDDLAEHSTGDPLARNDELEANLHAGFACLANTLADPWVEDFYRYQTKGRHFWKEPGVRELLVTEGCGYKCSFCAAKLAIGNTKSRPLQHVIRDLERAFLDKIPKVVLQGDEIGNYSDAGTNLIGLLRHAGELRKESGSRLALRYIHPDPLLRLRKELARFFTDDLVYYVCCALQTGNQAIANAMRRPQSIRESLDCLLSLRASNPRAVIHTQIIAGYPGETDEQFEDTLRLLREAEFDYVSYTKFDARPGTHAATLANQIPADVIAARYATVGQIVEGIRQKRLTVHARMVLGRAGFTSEMMASKSPLELVGDLAAKHAAKELNAPLRDSVAIAKT